ncbi:MAG: hypothetical protein JM58_06485 [Peptococcaceae bacterium BICA1-8]|nr:MAG: hypothetical protein JM58_06485 [Peptococcaceae bacterium BICA1-8]
MYKCILKSIFKLIITYMIFFFFFNNISAFASENSSRYVLIYDHLYKYAENSSDTLRQYMELKSDGQDVLLLQADKIDTEKIEQDSIIIIAASSFDSEKRYHQVFDSLNNYEVVVFDNEFISTGENLNNSGLILSIDKVYPFSDFNKLMGISEMLHDRGIDFIVTVMPVFDNYQLEAFDTYVRVLKYVSKMGGRLFVHYSVENKDVRYDTDARVGFKRAVEEFRKRGLEIIGITLSQEKMLNNIKVFEGLNLPFILTTEMERKIDPNLDLQKASQVLNNYIIINGININHFDYFRYSEKNYSPNQQSIYITINDDKEKLFNLIMMLNTERIPIRDFEVQDYQSKIQNFDYTKVDNISEQLEEKSQFERFLEEEMKKITGENLEQEQHVEGYDISWFTKVGIKIGIILLGILIIQVLTGRHFVRKKFLKD